VKRVLFILAVIIVVALVYFVIHIDKDKQVISPGREINSQANDSIRLDIADQEKPPDFPAVFDLSKLIIDSKLKHVKLNIPDTVYWKNSEINISAIIPSSVRGCDLYLLIDSKKKDMFYRVGGGTYEFKNVGLEKGKNVLEVFYRIRKRRSESSSSIVIRE
jgi:hypothetical protein